jgi:CubicO group peptidase (beta-lactamase class C family)
MRTIAVIAALIAVVFGRPHAETLTERLDRFVNAYLARNFSGSVLVAQNGKMLLSKGYGSANREHDVPATAQTKYRIGSITKQFTAAGILLLQQRGALTVQDPVRKYVPDAPAAWDAVTIHHLLTHTSGIININALPDYAKMLTATLTPRENVARLFDKPLQFPPGSKYQYSNSGYILLGHIIELISGRTYGAFLQENIFEPLGMRNTGYDDPKAILHARASGYNLEKTGLVHAPYRDMSIPYAAGALYSTVEDYYLWDQALYSDTPLSQKSRDAMFAPYVNDYGYGWTIIKQFNRTRIAHGGVMHGFASFAVRFPDERLCVVVFGNVNMAPSGEVAPGLAGLVLGEAVEWPKS